MQNKDVLDLLNDYSSSDSVMYRELNEESDDFGLRTGDVITLEPDDFKQILKNYSLLESLLESYYSNSKYKSHMWAILNKPCDMVKGRKFKSNLFIAPLQSFMAELRIGGIFEDYVEPPLAAKKPRDELIGIYSKFCKLFAKKLIPITPKMSKEQKKQLSKERSDFTRD